ncbi:cytochrome P450 2J6-like isoform X2 [Tachypleus tridentatus]|uniref:cytochrome P450 2J6-like isoform X2 n=1 Tax=Tachypleus tridentatus TaxID=6853 RepID=UPI003FD561A1
METCSDIAVANGNLWREQRRFSVHILRNLGFGKTKMEDHIQDEINIILAHLASLDGTVCDIRKLLVPSMSNIISAFVFGRRFDYDDPTRKYLDKRATEFQDYIKQFDLKTFFPWMKRFLSLLKPKESRKFQETSEQLLSFIREETDNHKKTLDENNVRDYIDAFLMEMKERQKRNKTSSFSDNMLYGNAQVWFLGGSNPIRTAIEWCLLTIAAYPDVQKRVQTEIDSVIGRERSPCWADHVFLPYTQAVLYEVQRWQTVNPLGILRYTREDTTVQGYNIPKETIVMNNIWAVHHDPRYWKNPGEFFPEHFLSQDGATVVKPEHFIPFSMGKRSCPGEKLTNIGMFLCFVSILQHFTVALPAGERPNFDGVFELSWDTKFHHIVFLSR